MRRFAIAFSVTAGLAAPAHADTFSGFSGVDRPYLVNQDRVCQPIVVASSTAAGAPHCEKAAADRIAKLSIKPPIVQSGARASFTAQAAGRTITVSRKAGGTVVTWDAADPVIRIAELYASVAVAYAVRRAGKEVTDDVAFDLGQNQTAVAEPPPAADTTAPPPAAAAPPPADPAIAKLIADARAAPRARALAAWAAVLAADAACSEALFRTAAAQLAARQPVEALASLQTLAASQRSDAIEWQIEARFDPAFAALRSDPKFRVAVGLDRKPTSVYERLMGFGGQWEQTGTACDKPEVHFVATRDRNFKLRVKTSCEGAKFDTPFRGTWRIDGQRIVLQLPTQGRKTGATDEAGCSFETSGDEDALRCSLGHDIDFTVLPTRR